jgi:amino acid transporter
MLLMFGLGVVVIIFGNLFDQVDYLDALSLAGTTVAEPLPDPPFQWPVFLSASAILFASFIGFDSIAQAGGEAKNPSSYLPLAIGLCMVSVSIYYFAFTSAVYHTVPWYYVSVQAAQGDVTAPGLLSLLIPPGWNVAIIAGAAVALTNDLPAMLLAVSRLVFAWSADGIFPKKLNAVHPRFNTPHRALILSGIIASGGIVGSHFAGDFFLGVDIMVLAMLVNFLAMCISVITLPYINPVLAADIQVVRSRAIQLALASLGILFLMGFLIIHIHRDITNEVAHWYYRSTPVWLLVMALGSIIYAYEFRKLKRSGTDLQQLFKNLPDQ